MVAHAKHNEVPPFVSVACDMECQDIAANVQTLVDADNFWASVQCLQGGRERVGVSLCLLQTKVLFGPAQYLEVIRFG